MKFEEILPALREGKKIRRNFWREDTYFYKNHLGTIIFKNGSEDTYYYDLSCLLNSNDWEIVKESKKVKLRDLTEEQYQKWILKNCDNYDDKCEGCPFQKVYCDRNPNIDDWWIRNKDLYSDKFLDQELEIYE